MTSRKKIKKKFDALKLTGTKKYYKFNVYNIHMLLLFIVMLTTLVSAQVPSPAPVEKITTGRDHTCAILDDGSVSCWGNNVVGQLGDGTNINRNTPTQTLPLGQGAVAISAGGTEGSFYTCALLDDGSVSCWGSNDYGQLGDGGVDDRNTPTQTLPLGQSAVAIAAGTDHTCAVLDDGSVSCWGSNGYGQLGDGTTTHSWGTPTQTSPFDTGKTAVAITAGNFHTCALLNDDSVSCWGSNSHGQLGDGTDINRNTPTQTLPLGQGAVAISAGSEHTCALLYDGSVSCWGLQLYGRLGNGAGLSGNLDNDWASVKTPTQTSPLGQSAVAISAGNVHTCAILDDGSVSCWGSYYYGQGGDRTSISKNTPTQTVPLGQVAVAISAGWRHTCALLDDDSVRCWGVNSEGQLGDGTNTGTILLDDYWPGTNYPIPTSELYCWGDNEKILACNAAQLEKVKRFYNRHPNSQCLLDDMLLAKGVPVWAKRRVPVVGDCSLSNEFLGCNDEQLKKIKRLYNLHPGKTCS